MKKFLICLSSFLILFAASTAFAGVYFEDFEDGIIDEAIWQPHGYYTISDGLLYMYGGYDYDPDDDNEVFYSDVGFFNPNDEIVDRIEADINVSSVQDQLVGLTCNLRDPEPGYYEQQISIFLVTSDGAGEFLAVFSILGGENINRSELIGPGTADESHHFSLTLHDDFVMFGVDGNEINLFEDLYQSPGNYLDFACYVHGTAHLPYDVDYKVDNLKVYSTTMSEPTPKIKVNGHDSPPPLELDDPIDITISLLPNKKLGEVCEIWIYALTHFGTHWLNSSSEWVKSNVPISNGQYALNEISEESLPAFQLPPGVATFNYVIDAIPNEVFDFSWYDSVNVIRKADGIIVQPDSKDMEDVWVTDAFHKGGKDNDYLITGGWGDYYYSLLKFDLTNLPSNVESAEIRLFCYSVYEPHTMYLGKVTEAWDEKTKWKTRPSSEELRTLPVPSPDEWYSIDITDLYNEWKNGVSDNYGIQLSPSRIDHSYNNFRSSDYTNDKSLRPKLVIVP